MELLFLGVGEQTERGAIGLSNAVKSGIIENIGVELYELLMKVISSICTDGANVNIGERSSFLEMKCENWGLRSHSQKCGALHIGWIQCGRTHLKFAFCNKKGTVHNERDLFIFSPIWPTNEQLKKIALEGKLDLLSLLKKLVFNILRSWQTLMTYFKENEDNDSEAKGFFIFLSKVENLRFIAFLAYLLQIFSRYHKKFQDDRLTIISLIQSIHTLQNCLVNLDECPLLYIFIIHVNDIFKFW